MFDSAMYCERLNELYDSAISSFKPKEQRDLLDIMKNKIGRFPNLKEQIAEVYAARFHGDRPLKCETALPAWIKPIQAGAALTDMRIAELTDNTGDNISDKNADYCELTALYWIWKNKICSDATISG